MQMRQGKVTLSSSTGSAVTARATCISSYVPVLCGFRMTPDHADNAFTVGVNAVGIPSQTSSECHVVAERVSAGGTTTDVVVFTNCAKEGVFGEVWSGTQTHNVGPSTGDIVEISNRCPGDLQGISHSYRVQTGGAEADSVQVSHAMPHDFYGIYGTVARTSSFGFITDVTISGYCGSLPGYQPVEFSVNHFSDFRQQDTSVASCPAGKAMLSCGYSIRPQSLPYITESVRLVANYMNGNDCVSKVTCISSGGETNALWSHAVCVSG
ncbi:unnamed protein product [Chrysoparadoxa australica]